MKLVSWNVEGRLSRFAKNGRRGSPEHILSAIRELDGDILFLPEAYDSERPLEQSVKDTLNQLGYEYADVAYEQKGKRDHAAVVKPHMLLGSRYKILRVETLPMVGGIRNMMCVDVLDPTTDGPIRIFGIHLDDKSEKSRLIQLKELLPKFDDLSAHPTIAMGDFNAMSSGSIQARFLRTKAAHFVIGCLPKSSTRDILERLSDMAVGTTIRNIEALTNLVSSDTKGRSTTTPKMRGQEWMPSIPMVQIDHIFVAPQFTTSGFKVSRDNGSDHRAISVSTRQNL